MYRRMLVGSALILLSMTPVCAQQTTAGDVAKASLTITASVSTDHVRIAAPASVVQMHVEIYAVSGEKLFDNEIRGGNVFDWYLQNGQAERLPAGEYVCVVTVKNVAGQLSQKTGVVKVGAKDVLVAPSDSAKLSLPQTQAIGPVEADSSWRVMTNEENQTTTVIAHDGTDGQITRGRGALSFRLGDFFSGNNEEQMRLTEEGNLGIGTSKPKFKLDVAGPVRARQGFVFNNGSTLNVNDKGALTVTDTSGNITPNATGSGTQGRLAKWTDNAGTLGDANVFEDGSGRIGIGTTVPGARLHTIGVPGSLGAGTFQLDSSTLFTNWTATYPAFELLNTNQTNNNVSLFQFSDMPSGAAYAGVGGVATNHANKFGDLFLFTKGNDGYQPRLGIYSGNVGIGTTAPASPLDVAGDINTSAAFNIRGNRVLAIGGSDVYVGQGAGPAQPQTHANSFFGFNSGQLITTGGSNSFFGVDAGFNTTTGNRNNFFGYFAGSANSTGHNNVFLGDIAGDNNTSGSFNVFIGSGAPSSNPNLLQPTGGTNLTGNNNTLIGAGSDVASDGLTNAIAIGFDAQVAQSNSLVLGSINGVNNATTDTKVGIGITAPTFRLHVIDPLNQGLRVQTNTTGGTVASFGGKGAFQIDSSGVVGGRLWVTESGNVAIGSSTAPTDKLFVGGDTRVNGTLRVPGGSIFVANPNTLIITSPNGACWGITVNNSGALSTFSTACP